IPHQGPVRALRFSPNRDVPLLAVVGVGTVELWDPVAGTLSLSASRSVTDLAFAPDGGTLIAGLEPPRDRPATTAEAASGSEARATPPPPTSQVWEVIEPVGRVRLTGFDARPGG